jgi:hypothetical protein
MITERMVEEHTFSIEMKSKNSLNHVCLSDISAEPVLIRGELGMFDEINFYEDVTLEIRGSKGTLRLDISREELETLLRARK